MKIVVLDGYTENPGDLSWEELEKLGDVTVYDRSSRTDEDEAIARIGEAEIVITNKTPITKKILDACPSIRYIGLLSTGYNIADYVYARGKGIPVTNVPGYGTDTVAQYTFALLLEICHHVAHHSEAVYAGRWEKCEDFCFWDFSQIELVGKTMGIIGFGRIGQKVGAIAKAFGMKVLAYSPHEYESGRTIGTYVSLDTLLAESDIISLHCPLFPETEGLINKETIDKMKDGAILLNTGRGQLVVEQDLADALNSGKLAAAAMDVVSTEPIEGDNPLLGAKNCIITPHIAWAAKEARQRIMDCAVSNLKAYLKGEPENVVNP